MIVPILRLLNHKRRNAAPLDLREAARSAWRSEKAAVVAQVFVALVALIVVMSWYRGNQLVWGSDENLPLSLTGISRYFQISDATLSAPDVRKLPFIMPLAAALWLWDKLGLPYDPGFFQRSLFAISMGMAGIGMFRLLRAYLPRLEILPAVGASFYFMFNLFALITIWTPLSNLVFHYCLLPFVLLSWLWALRRRSLGSAVVAGLVWSLTLTPSYGTTPIVVTDFLLFAGIAVVELWRIKGSHERRQLLVTVGTIVAVWLAMNSFWIVPTLDYLRAEGARGLAAGNPADLVALNSVPFDEAIRLGGYWGLTSGFKGSPYFPWASFYTSGWGGWISFLLPLVALAAAWQLPRLRLSGGVSDDTSTYIKFFFLVLAISLLLMTGPNQPLGAVKAMVMERSALFAPFRSVYQRFGEYAALAYAPLVGAGLQYVASFLQRNWPRSEVASNSAVAIVAAVLATTLALPMWTGTLFDRSGVIPSKRVTIPAEYATVARWIDDRTGDFTVVPFPYGPSGLIALSWKHGDDGYLGDEPLQLLSNKPFLHGDPSAPYLTDLVVQASGGGIRALPALRLLNARYIVVHLDANSDYLAGLDGWAGIDTQQLVSVFDNTPGLTPAFAAGRLRVYEVTDWRPFQLFAVTRNPGFSNYSLPVSDVRPIRYEVLGPGNFSVPEGQLSPGDILVVNHPYDPQWTASGASLISIDPGLTAFRIERTGPVLVAHQLQEQFPLLLVLPVAAIAILAILTFVWRRWQHKRLVM